MVCDSEGVWCVIVKVWCVVCGGEGVWCVMVRVYGL